jgi:hypothetical protein
MERTQFRLLRKTEPPALWTREIQSAGESPNLDHAACRLETRGFDLEEGVVLGKGSRPGQSAAFLSPRVPPLLLPLDPVAACYSLAIR